VVFSPDWLGPMNTSAADGHTIAEGRWARLPVAKDGEADYRSLKPMVSKFGILNTPTSMNNESFSSRTVEVCGLKNPFGFSPPELLFDCFETLDAWNESSACVYTNGEPITLSNHGSFTCDRSPSRVGVRCR
jgi:hypothetical protein